MLERNKIELLAPARTAEHGIAAIRHGADAVYIGGPAFSARAAAANSIADIERLVKYAHTFDANVLVALNTILTDDELSEASKVAHQLYDAGVDALIVQDYGILKADLPPIPLHASTQMDNRSADKVKWLEDCGFEQVVLARELSTEQIAEIAAQTTVRLEAFIHGALCVSYSGQCYLSQKLMGRSANRGECAQPCRLPYTLVDSDGKTIEKDRYLLSLRDLSADAMLAEMIRAGVSTFKIEGRLKDIEYVKNVTAYYRRRIDTILESMSGFERSSIGRTTMDFEPDLQCSFNRGLTTYHLTGERTSIFSPFTPKSMGEELGRMTKIERGRAYVDSDKQLSNGDGFCFVADGELVGFRANTAQKGMIDVPRGINIPHGAVIYRNFNKAFEDHLAKSRCDRRIPVSISASETECGVALTLRGPKMEMTHCVTCSLQKAENAERANRSFVEVMQKSGDTAFAVESVELKFSDALFFPMSVIANMRRELLEAAETKYIDMHTRGSVIKPKDEATYPASTLDYRGNVHNAAAKAFLQSHGVRDISQSFERMQPENVELMRCHHCIRWSLGLCLKEKRGANVRGPLYLIAQSGKRLELVFDCTKCEMAIKG